MSWSALGWFVFRQRKLHQVLKTLLGSRIRFALSTPLLFEYENVLKRNQAALNLTDLEVDVVWHCGGAPENPVRGTLMTTFNLSLPSSIQRHLQEMADLDGVSINCPRNY